MLLLRENLRRRAVTTTAQEIYRLALELEPEERAELIEQLSVSLYPEQDDELARVVKRRMDEVAAGTAQLVSRAELRSQLQAIADS